MITTKTFQEFLVASVLCAGVYYSATTAWKNEERLSNINSDVKSLKSVVLLLLDDNPDENSIINKLISHTPFLNGAKEFRLGNYTDAVQTWKVYNQNGDEDIAYIMSVADSILRSKLESKTYNSIQEESDIKDALAIISKMDATIESKEVMLIGDMKSKHDF